MAKTASAYDLSDAKKRGRTNKLICGDNKQGVVTRDRLPKVWTDCWAVHFDSMTLVSVNVDQSRP